MYWLKYTSVGIKTTLKVNNYTYTKQNTQKRTKSNIYQGPLSGIKYVISPLQNILVIGFWWTQLIPYKAIEKIKILPTHDASYIFYYYAMTDLYSLNEHFLNLNSY